MWYLAEPYQIDESIMLLLHRSCRAEVIRNPPDFVTEQLPSPEDSSVVPRVRCSSKVELHSRNLVVGHPSGHRVFCRKLWKTNNILVRHQRSGVSDHGSVASCKNDGRRTA